MELNNEYNHQYKSFEKVLIQLEKIFNKKDSLKGSNMNIKVKIQKSVFGYWNLKLIMNGRKSSKKTSLSH